MNNLLCADSIRVPARVHHAGFYSRFLRPVAVALQPKNDRALTKLARFHFIPGGEG